MKGKSPAEMSKMIRPVLSAMGYSFNNGVVYPENDDLVKICTKYVDVKAKGKFSENPSYSEVHYVNSRDIPEEDKEVIKKSSALSTFFSMRNIKVEDVSFNVGYGNRKSGCIFNTVEEQKEGMELQRIILNLGHTENYLVTDKVLLGKKLSMPPTPSACFTLIKNEIGMMDISESDTHVIRVSKNTQNRIKIEGNVVNNIRPNRYLRKTCVLNIWFSRTTKPDPEEDIPDLVPNAPDPTEPTELTVN